MKFLTRFILILTLLFFTGNLVKVLFTGTKTEQCQVSDDDDDDSENENDSDEESKVEFEWFFQVPETAQMPSFEPVKSKLHFHPELFSYLLKPYLETNHQPPEC